MTNLVRRAPLVMLVILYQAGKSSTYFVSMKTTHTTFYLSNVQIFDSTPQRAFDEYAAEQTN